MGRACGLEGCLSLGLAVKHYVRGQMLLLNLRDQSAQTRSRRLLHSSCP